MKGLDLPARLRVLTVASCSCMTKTHNPAMHAESSLFRVLCEAADELERLERAALGLNRALDAFWNDRWQIGCREMMAENHKRAITNAQAAFLKSPDAGALASQQKEEPPMAQRFGYTGPHEQGDTYVKFAQLFDAPNGGEGFDLTVRDGDGKSTTLRLPPDEAHKMAMALMPAPVPTGATPTDWAEAKAAESILQFFTFDHLPPHLQDVSGPFAYRALSIVQTLPRNPERTVALRKLLEAKDAAVRALLFK